MLITHVNIYSTQLFHYKIFDIYQSTGNGKFFSLCSVCRKNRFEKGEWKAIVFSFLGKCYDERLGLVECALCGFLFVWSSLFHWGNCLVIISFVQGVFIKILSGFGSSGISQNIDGNLGTILGYSGPKVLEM
jgi:hypothetical protein